MISLFASTNKSIKLSQIIRISLVPLFYVLLFTVAGTVSASGTFPATVTLLKNREYPDALLKSIRNSRKSVFLSFYLFKISPSHSSLPGKIVEELIKAGNRGVDVTVIFEISEDLDDQLNEANRQTASLLSRKGIRVLFDSPRRKSHMKTVLIDDRYIFIGSHNLTQSAMKYNNEISVLIDSTGMASEVRTYLKSLSVKHSGTGPEHNNGDAP